MWNNYWISFPANHVVLYDKIVPLPVVCPWFHNLKLFSAVIAQFIRLSVGHYHLPSYAYYIGLNNSPIYPQYTEMIDNFQYLIFSWLMLYNTRVILFNEVSRLDVP